MPRTNSRTATCHPGKPHYALGLCQWCWYQRRYRADPELAARDRAARLVNQRAWRKAHKHDEPARHLMAAYGLTPEGVANLLAVQGGRCAICDTDITGVGKKMPRAKVDHCHETGRVRGLLCHTCNLGLGQLGDTVEALKRALNYLEQSEP